MYEKNNNSWFVSRRECPICNSLEIEIIYEDRYDKSPLKDYLTNYYSWQGGVEFEYLEGAHYVLCKCSDCGLIFQKDIPNDFLMERLYEHWIDPNKIFLHHKNTDSLEYFSHYAQEIMQIISYFNTLPSALDFFDFGMGWGKWALMANAFGCNTSGTELSYERIKYAELNGINVIKMEELSEHSFDFINAEQVFEHIPKPLETLIHLKKALKPDGIIKINVPNAKNISQLLKTMDWKSSAGSKNAFIPINPLEHINLYRKSTILKMADIVGMEEVHIPLQKQCQYIVSCSGLKGTIKNILRPFNERFIKNHNYTLLRIKK